MSSIAITGCGAVSPAGWGVKALLDAVEKSRSIPPQTVTRPGGQRPLAGRPVPPPPSRPAFLAQPRLRRTSPIAQFAVGAALEALGDNARLGAFPAGIIYCSMAGCVNFSKRFYAEVLKEPATASPLVFPETVFNAPASHLAALLGSDAISYTLVGDQGTFLQGLALAAAWLEDERVQSCLVVGAEELDWLTVEALGLFDRQAVASEGAGAMYLERLPDDATGGVCLRAITEPQLFSCGSRRRAAAAQARAELPTPPPNSILCLGTQGAPKLDREEAEVWQNWTGPSVAPKQVLGEAFMASAAWQCVIACELVRQCRYAAANVSVVGSNQQAVAAQFCRARAA